MKETIKIGTRGSALALAQTRIVRDRLKAIGITNAPIIEIQTTGDRSSFEPTTEIGGKGVFVREIEKALLAGEIDIAVHSLKDMPARMSDRLAMAAYLTSNNPFDILVTRNRCALNKLPAGSRIGTGSPRRVAWLKKERPRLRSVPIRGNVDTRLRKLASGEYDAIILAAAGLERLGMDYDRGHILPIVPSPGQGVIAVQTRASENEILQILAGIDNRDQRTTSTIERGLLAELGATCHTPIGLKGRLTGNGVTVDLFLSDADMIFFLEKRYLAPIEGAISEISASIRADWQNLSGRELRL